MSVRFMSLIGIALAFVWSAIYGLGYLGWRVYALYPHPIRWIAALYVLSFVIAVTIIGILDQRRTANIEDEAGPGTSPPRTP